MSHPRVIPCLLLKDDGLVKTVRFARPKYVGDPINAVKLFNELEVDELIILDISATAEKRDPDLKRVQQIASECFMPICYGGGVTTVEQGRRLIEIGVEKVALTTAAFEQPELVSRMAKELGSQSVVVGIDVSHDLFRRRRVYIQSGKKKTGFDPVQYARELERRGAGELLLTSIDRDGCQKGYDLDLIHAVSEAVQIPVIACGGAGSLNDLAAAVQAGASAIAAGSLFVFMGQHRAVLINYPTRDELRRAIFPGSCSAS